MIGKLLFGLALLLCAGLGGADFTNAKSVSYIASESSVVASTGGRSRIAERVATGPFASPDRIYEKVWDLINDDYYDGSFNGQDWKRWKHKYDGKLKTSEDAHKAVETMLASLGDRYTRFLDKDAFDDEHSQIDAHICGIGVQIGLNKAKKISVITPIEDTPAFKAGVKAGDEIVEIDKKNTHGFTVDEAAKHIRGQINTDVELVLMRKGEKVVLRITRAEIPLKAVQNSQMLGSDIGYIRLSSFISKEADKEVADSLGKLSNAKAIILDLRENPGGLLNNAINISNMFLKNGIIVSTVDRDGYKKSEISNGHPLCALPMAVLIDKGSASASEITSGALKDNARAILVGDRTFGKGLVQGINHLEDGTGVNITIARYLTPNDTDINKKGISPDIEVKLAKRTKDSKSAWDGPWWLDPDSPSDRKADDMKDAQLKKAFEAMKAAVATGTSVAMTKSAK